MGGLQPKITDWLFAHRYHGISFCNDPAVICPRPNIESMLNGTVDILGVKMIGCQKQQQLFLISRNLKSLCWIHVQVNQLSFYLPFVSRSLWFRLKSPQQSILRMLRQRPERFAGPVQNTGWQLTLARTRWVLQHFSYSWFWGSMGCKCRRIRILTKCMKRIQAVELQVHLTFSTLRCPKSCLMGCLGKSQIDNL